MPKLICKKKMIKMRNFSKSVLAFVFAVFSGSVSFAETTATASDGRIVVLEDNGTWREMKVDSLSEEGKVNVKLMGISGTSRGCTIKIQIENLSNEMFKDYAPNVYAYDTNGFEVGSLGIANQTNNFRPGSLASANLRSDNVPCDELGQIVFSGWQYSCSRTQLCQELLNIIPDQRIPIVQK